MLKKRKEKLFTLIILVSLVTFLGSTLWGYGKMSPEEIKERYSDVCDFVEDNEQCLRCHGEPKFQLKNEETGLIITRLMCRDHLILREDYYQSNHKSFACFDCHSGEYSEFPHPLEIRLEEPWTCMDCHGYDEEYAHYQFEKIDEEYQESTHHLATDEFSCWKCHNPHTYKISIRDTENLSATIAYDNGICLSCHADFDQFQLLTDRDGINIIKTHEWLPNQALHFQKVRCIECHTLVSDSILVAHLVQPKEKAVRLCSECHSSNSLLMHTLYKFEAKEARGEYGFVNAVVMNNAYVIGANRNYYLNLISAAIFVLTFLGLAIHILLRITKKV